MEVSILGSENLPALPPEVLTIAIGN